MADLNAAHISVCIPTYKRPGMLAKCLDALMAQRVSGFTYSIVVVDNDPEQSAEPLLRETKKRSSIGVIYVAEAEPNISRARNKAIASAVGEYIAFIDDDEIPEPSWLLNLYETCRDTSADAVLGPVLPRFEETPPDWLVRSGLCDRKAFATGTRLGNPRYLRTGNVLLRSALFEGMETPFDPRLGRTGGEDADLLGRMAAAGRAFVWCNEARVHELVPLERQTLNYHLRRAAIRGVTEADKEALLSYGTAKSAIAVVVYALALPFLLIARYHLFARYLVKWCDHLSKLLAHVGVKLARERSF